MEKSYFSRTKTRMQSNRSKFRMINTDGRHLRRNVSSVEQVVRQKLYGGLTGKLEASNQKLLDL